MARYIVQVPEIHLMVQSSDQLKDLLDVLAGVVILTRSWKDNKYYHAEETITIAEFGTTEYVPMTKEAADRLESTCEKED